MKKRLLISLTIVGILFLMAMTQMIVVRPQEKAFCISSNPKRDYWDICIFVRNSVNKGR